MIYLGKSFQTGVHRHHAAQVVISLKGEARISIDGEWGTYSALLISPNQKHQLGLMGTVAMFYLEPESKEYELFTRNIKSRINFEVPQNFKEKLLSCLDDPFEKDKAETLFLELIANNGAGINEEIEGKTDERILKCTRFIENNINEDLSLSNLAYIVGLSEGRLTHLFKEKVGIPIRRYILWNRIKCAIFLSISQGYSLTSASHLAGFSDQAHLTNSFKNIFGIKPTFLFSSKLKLLHFFSRIKI